MEKFRGQYRISSTRASFWDYSNSAMYFITICTHCRKSWFGKVRAGKIILSEIGQIVQTEWLETFAMRPDMNLWKGEFIVMPNHFHAIIGIGENRYNTLGGGGVVGGGDRNGDDVIVGNGRDAMHCVSTTPPATILRIPATPPATILRIPATPPATTLRVPATSPPATPATIPMVAPPVTTPPVPTASIHKTRQPSSQNQFGPQSKNLASIVRGFKSAVTKNARAIQPEFSWQPRYHDHIIRDNHSFRNISNYIINNPTKWEDDKFYLQ